MILLISLVLDLISTFEILFQKIEHHIDCELHWCYKMSDWLDYVLRHVDSMDLRLKCCQLVLLLNAIPNN